MVEGEIVGRWSPYYCPIWKQVDVTP